MRVVARSLVSPDHRVPVSFRWLLRIITKVVFLRDSTLPGQHRYLARDPLMLVSVARSRYTVLRSCDESSYDYLDLSHSILLTPETVFIFVGPSHSI